jgi:hypothetical protein
VKFTVRDTFNCTVDTYWSEIFFEPEYNERLYKEGLGFKGFELESLTGDKGGPRERVMITEPAADAPAVVRKLIGDSLTYRETGTWSPDDRIWRYDIVTSKLSDKVKIGGILYAEPKGDDKCVRVADIEISVKVFGVGGAVEKFIERTTRDSYVKATKFTNDYIAEKGL